MVPYDVFTNAFLEKITEYDFLTLPEKNRTETVDGYMKRAVAEFRHNCKYDLFTTPNDQARMYEVDVSPEDLDELTQIISEGMVAEWMKPFQFNQDLLQNVLNTRDFTTYSPAELQMRVGNARRQAHADFIQMIREYSYNHGDLKGLHI